MNADACVLEGVRRVGYYPDLPGSQCPEDVPFTSALSACLEYLGWDRQASPLTAHGRQWELNGLHVHLMAVSGASFFLSWVPGWASDNVSLHYMADDAEARFRYSFAALGLSYHLLGHTAGGEDDATLRRAVVESIRDRRQPLLAFGVIGPPEASVVAGYEQDGEVVLGWSFFQTWPEYTCGVEYAPNGYFRKANWIPETECLLVFGEAGAPPEPQQVVRDTLTLGTQIMHRGTIYGGSRYVGLRAIEAWAEQLLHDDEVAADRDHTFSVHDDAVGTLAEARWYGHLWLRRVADDGLAPPEPLRAAADCFHAEHDLMWEAWGVLGGNGRDEAHRAAFAVPANRRRLREIILRARDLDATAADHLTAALAQMP